MRQIIVEPCLEQKLSKTPGQVALCDEAGRILGFFSPNLERPGLEELQLEPPLSIEETEILRKQHRTGKMLEEILGRLGL